MARFDIISKDGCTVRYSGKPRYSGSYLKPSYLEFTEIASPVPIPWEVGDYVDYPRTGMRYRLYSIPHPSKNARRNAYGAAFTYSNVQLYAATKELEIALFRDLVINDNNIHFSTLPDVATFEDVYGIARRIQACMDDLYPDRWTIRVADFDENEDSEIIDKISGPKDFALSNGTCLDALSKIYELWQDIGWIHSYDAENEKDVITIGYANKRIDANTSDAYLYGKGNGLTAIKKNQTNKDEFATRLYIYGSERNLPSRYYNSLDILNAESVDIRNLMIPTDQWGQTDGLPDARKAYIENAEMVKKYGIVPKVHYFDSIDAGADIYPSLEGMTIGDIRKVLDDMGQTSHYPSTFIYPDDNERADEVISAANPEDDGKISPDGDEYDALIPAYIVGDTASTILPAGNASPTIYLTQLLSRNIEYTGKGTISVIGGVSLMIPDHGYTSVKVTVELTDSITTKNRYAYAKQEMLLTEADKADSGAWVLTTPNIKAKYNGREYTGFPVNLNVEIEVNFATPPASDVNASYVIYSTDISIGFKRILSEVFTIDIKQVGFDISERAELGNGKVISMKTGNCAGRNFVISDCSYISDSDSWRLTCKRQKDKTLGMLFPYSGYGIESGDRFVLVDIAMPELYIRTAMERLLDEGQKLLARASRILYHYEPSIDAKVMEESGRILREGMFMEVTDADVIDGGTEYILIDTLSIYEDESTIPTYKVTLRERRKVTYKGTPSATSTTETSSVSEDDVSTDINPYGYALKSDLQDVSDSLSEMWRLDSEGNVWTDRNVYSTKQIAAGGNASGEDGGTAETGVQAIQVGDTLYQPEDGIVTLPETAQGIESIGDAEDVDVADVQDGDTLVYNGDTGMFENRPSTYVHNQNTASAEWKIVHGMGKYPAVAVIDSAGTVVYGDITYNDQDTVTLTFAAAFSGKATLN